MQRSVFGANLWTGGGGAGVLLARACDVNVAVACVVVWLFFALFRVVVIAVGQLAERSKAPV